ncbi:Thioredoxin [Cohnella sp. OV330]|uniref:thioredoxin family protein n=1 Tax=Cohnella sp. OV330 TaxID=1855288 RepID=UPI0008F136BF|nr:thioredoxin family protein [Cohnella sp. OV330]SFB16406.1 Thioredoxin [Cohnella sp. OV330]
MTEWEARTWKREVEASEGALALFVYTPLCGTCALARRMLEVAEASLTNVRIASANINLMPGMAEAFQIESVPCLLLRRQDGAWNKVYRFGSVVEVRARLAESFGGEENDHDRT